MPDAISLVEELKKLQTELENNQAEAASLKARIADITKTAGDIEQKNKDFEKAAATNETTVQELKEFIDCKKKVLEPKVSTADIAKKKKEAEESLQATKKAADDAAKLVRDREAEVAKAKETIAAKQKVFDEVSGRRARNAEILKELEALRVAIEKQAANPWRAYFLLLLIMDRLNELKLTKPADYAKELNDAGTALAEAIKAPRIAEQALDKAKADEKAAAKKFQDEQAKWVETMLAFLPSGNPAPLTSAAPPPPSQSIGARPSAPS